MMTAAQTPPPSGMSAALKYLERGWSPIPVKRGSKAPVGGAWQRQRLTREDVLSRFGPTDNVGVLLGEPSNWLVDVDLDTQEAIDLAPRFLPPTGAVFGRASKRSSHWLYVAEGANTKRLVTPDATLLELRATGLQTIFPGSVHPSGEPITWEASDAPSLQSASGLAERVSRLAVATLLVRVGCDHEGACHLATDDKALLEMKGDVGKLVREWLGLAPPQETRASRSSAELNDAIRRYNNEHSREWPRSGGECPICRHKGCFGRMPGSDGRWYCFSAAHSGGGVAGKYGYHGDALDVDAHSAGIGRVELLRRDGYLAQRVHLRPVPTGGDPGAPRGREEREIVITTDVERVTDEALDALAASDVEVYHRGGLLVQVVADEATVGGVTYTKGSQRLAPMAKARMLELMSSSAKWVRVETRGRKTSEGGTNERETKPAMPPGWAVDTVMSRGRWPMLRRLAGVVEMPVMRPDGSVVDKPGYDEATGLLYRPMSDVRVPVSPTQSDAIAARDELLDVVCDFPFANDAYKASWLACALTPFARYAYDGPTPLFLVDANTRGSGKSLLADVIGHIVFGKPVPRMPPADDEAEERKRLTAIAIAGTRMVLIDNVKRLGSTALDAALTTTWWQDRVLGQGVMFDGELLAVFMATGNNVELVGDLARRVCHIRLESPHECPEQRSDFKHPELLGWAKQEAPRLARAALTILRAYSVAGRPAQKVKNWGSYEGWNRLIAHAVAWVGMPDPNEARQELVESADHERRALAVFLAEFRKYATWGSSVRDMLHDIEIAASTHAKLRDALYELCPPYKGKSQDAKAIGKRLSSFKGRVANGMKLQGEPDSDGVYKWKVIDA